MQKVARVTWVVCPNCKYLYYVGPAVLNTEGALAVCPKCRHEFDAKSNLGTKVKDHRIFF